MPYEVEQLTESQVDKDVTVNDATSRIEGATSSLATVAMADADVDLGSSSANELVAFSNLVFDLTGANTAIRELQLPDASNGAGKVYVVENSTTGGFDVRVIRRAGGTGVLIPPGERYMVYNDHTNVVFLTTLGTAGASVAATGAFLYAFDSSTSMADPGSGDVRLNNAMFASVTAAAISDTDSDGADRDSVLDSAGSFRLLLRKASDPSAYAFYDVTAAATDNGAWHQLSLDHVGSNGSFTNGDSLVAQLVVVDGHDRFNWTDENTQSGSYSLVASDAGKAVIFTGSSVATFSVPSAASLGSRVFLVHNVGTAVLTVASEASPAENINGVASLQLANGQSCILWSDGTSAFRAMVAGGSGSGGLAREVLGADRTYYVRTDGNDTNDGLTNSSGGAFLTIQRAVDVIAGLDLSIYTVTIQLGNTGTYSTRFEVTAPWIGGPGAEVVLRGDPSSPSSYLVSATGNTALLQDGGRLSVSGVKLAGTGSAVLVRDKGILSIADTIDFGASGAHLAVYADGLVRVEADYDINGSADRHYDMRGGKVTMIGTRTVSLFGTLAFAAAFVEAKGSGAYGDFQGAAFDLGSPAATVTGLRYDASLNGSLNTGGTGGNTMFPGNSPGSVPSDAIDVA